jgi:hypothetical protein
LPKDQWSTWEEHKEKVSSVNLSFYCIQVTYSLYVLWERPTTELIPFVMDFQGCYLQPYIDEVVKEHEEREAWDKN